MRPAVGRGNRTGEMRQRPLRTPALCNSCRRIRCRSMPSVFFQGQGLRQASGLTPEHETRETRNWETRGRSPGLRNCHYRHALPRHRSHPTRNISLRQLDSRYVCRPRSSDQQWHPHFSRNPGPSGGGAVTGNYTVSGGGCDDSGTAVLQVAGAWDY